MATVVSSIVKMRLSDTWSTSDLLAMSSAVFTAGLPRSNTEAFVEWMWKEVQRGDKSLTKSVALYFLFNQNEHHVNQHRVSLMDAFKSDAASDVDTQSIFEFSKTLPVNTSLLPSVWKDREFILCVVGMMVK